MPKKNGEDRGKSETKAPPNGMQTPREARLGWRISLMSLIHGHDGSLAAAEVSM
ncbi:predicted protein [Plenodomus lingam JN3]|uniref:Predicted protein n=1 Tax=Leptosphaeria maculans (strain JN3 / isolate v23.1.3 / race Av1-4-5-6-7-8) TaxID=985895 RepID=E4ZHJ6_LEPMJ|nr:predicted protein [Plenodomus lingam JN3]CBX90829.1 predicted protein [Plenodomus lingam JN3]